MKKGVGMLSLTLVGLLLSLFGGVLLGSGAEVLFNTRPFYPKPIGAVFVVIGTILTIVGFVVVVGTLGSAL